MFNYGTWTKFFKFPCEQNVNTSQQRKEVVNRDNQLGKNQFRI